MRTHIYRHSIYTWTLERNKVSQWWWHFILFIQFAEFFKSAVCLLCMFRFNVNSFVIDITIVVVSLLSFILSFYICLSVWLPLIPFLCCDGRDVLALFLFILFNRNSVAVSLYLFINIFIYSGGGEGGGDFQLVSTFTCFFLFVISSNDEHFYLIFRSTLSKHKTTFI